MIISKAKPQDKVAIKKLWVNSFPLESLNATYFYFEKLFRIEDTYVMKIQDEIVCMLQTRPIQIMMKQPIKVSFIVGVATSLKHQHKGYMKQLLHTVLTRLEKEEPCTLLQAYDWDLYKPFGFNIAYYHHKVTLDKEKYKNQVLEGIVDDCATSKELLHVYEAYTKGKNGYRIRNEAYYDFYLKPYSAYDGLKWLCIRNKKKELIGYAIYEEDEKVIVSECIVKNQDAKDILIKSLLIMNKEVIIYCCEDECFYGKTEKVPAMMIRNNSNITYEKPLFINEVL